MIYQDAPQVIEIPGLPKIARRSSWYFHAKDPAGGYFDTYIDRQTLIDNDRKKPLPADTKYCVLDIEMPGPDHNLKMLESLYALWYYQKTYPNVKFGMYEMIPRLDFNRITNGQRFHDIKVRQDSMRYTVDTQDNSPAGKLLSAQVDFVTLRGYVYRKNLQEHLALMTEQVWRARQLGKRLFVYLTPHYLDDGSPIDSFTWARLLEYCVEVWGAEPIVWLEFANVNDCDMNAPWRQATLDFIGQTQTAPQA